MPKLSRAIFLIVLLGSAFGAEVEPPSPASVLPVAQDIPNAGSAAVSGRIVDATGEPVTDATVFVYTAGPKSGPATVCPSCYPDCGKTARSDAAGQFTLLGLSRDLLFRLLVVAPGRKAVFVREVAAGTNAPTVTLRPHPTAVVLPRQLINGRIVGPDGTPVFGAMIEVRGLQMTNQSTHWGNVTEVDPIAITDERGEFRFIATQPLVGVHARVFARGLAPQAVVLSFGASSTLALTEGATLTGRLLHAGQPLAGVTLVARQRDRDLGAALGDFETATDAEGRFSFLNLPPQTDYQVFGRMETLGGQGASPVRPVHVGGSGRTTDVGDWTLQSSHRLSGRLIFTDGTTPPPETRLILHSRDTADTIAARLTSDGAFSYGGLPKGVFRLNLSLPDYTLSRRNGSYDSLTRQLLGRVDNDTDGLEILVDKINLPIPAVITLSPGTRPVDPSQAFLSQRPLQGVEPAQP